MHTINVRLTDVKYGNNKNHLKFRGEVPYYSNQHDFEFDYTGIEITSNGNIGEDVLNGLAKQMAQDFGHNPFDIKKAKKILRESRTYTIRV